MSSIRFERLHPLAEPPRRATAGSAGHDLAAFLIGGSPVKFHSGRLESERVPTVDGDSAIIVLAPGERAIVPLGFRATLPEGYEAQIRPRSGTSFRSSLALANSPGTIDPDYHHEWGVLVRNDGDEPLVIRHGERIAQMVIARYETPTFEEGPVGKTTERAGGFGSTGRS